MEEGQFRLPLCTITEDDNDTNDPDAPRRHGAGPRGATVARCPAQATGAGLVLLRIVPGGTALDDLQVLPAPDVGAADAYLRWVAAPLPCDGGSVHTDATGEHTQQVGQMAHRLAEALGLPAAEAALMG
jgi:hypothetical protein